MSELEDKLNGLLSDPEEFGKVAQMAKNLMDGGLGEKLSGMFDGGPEQGGTEKHGAAAPDADMLAGLGRVMSAANAGSDKTALLDAMKPYLAEKRRGKVDRALKIARIARIAGAAFGENGGAGDGV